MKLSDLDKLDNEPIFNFKNLISKYSKGAVTVINGIDGYYDMSNGGVWVDAKDEEIDVVPAAIVPLSKDDLRFLEGGVMSEDNKKLYCYLGINKGAKIKNTMVDGKVSTYTILQENDYTDYDSGLRIYYLKRIDSND